MHRLPFALLICLVMAGCAHSPIAVCPLAPDREQRIESEITQTLFSGEPIRLRTAGDPQDFLAIWRPGRADRPAIVLAHGPGRHIGSPIINETAMALEALGYATLTLQMPMQRQDCEGGDVYPQLFDAAVARIDAAARWLQGRHPAGRALFAHWIGNEYLARTPNAPFDAWIVNGITGRFGTIGDNEPRILDVYGSQGHPMTLRAAWWRRLWLGFRKDGQQQVIEGANQNFDGRYQALADAIDQFLTRAPRAAR